MPYSSRVTLSSKSVKHQVGANSRRRSVARVGQARFGWWPCSSAALTPSQHAAGHRALGWTDNRPHNEVALMSSAVKSPSAFAASVAVVPPVASHEVALHQAKPRVSAAQGRALIELADIAHHDRDVANALRARLDFTEVADGGSRVSARDAYAVLDARELERFDLIHKGVREREDHRSTASQIMRWTVGVALGVSAGVGVLASAPAWLVAVGAVFCTGCAAAFASIPASSYAEEGQKRFDNVTDALRALPAPRPTDSSEA